MKKALQFVARVIMFTFVYLVLVDIGNYMPAIAKAITHTDTPIMWVVNMVFGGAMAAIIWWRKIGGRANIILVVLGFLFGIIVAELAWHFKEVLPKMRNRLSWEMLIGIGITTVASLPMWLKPKK